MANANEKMVSEFGMRFVKYCIILVILWLFKSVIFKFEVFNDMRFFDTRLVWLDVIGSAIHAIMLVFTIKFGFDLERRYEIISFPKAMTILKWIAIITAVMIAYTSFFEVTCKIVGGKTIKNDYKMIFLVLTLAVLIRFSILIFSNFEKISDFFTGKIKLNLRVPVAEDDAEVVDNKEKKCACGKIIVEGEKFCSSCGAKVQ